MAALTLNQIIQRLQSLAISHSQINHFFIGSLDEFLDDADVTYPACFVELKNATISRTDKKTTYQFKFYFLDLLGISKEALVNEWEIKSDLMLVAQDYIAMLNYSGYQNDWTIEPVSNLEIVDYQLNDLCAGVSCTINIATRYENNRCQVPATNVTFESPQNSEGVPMWYDAKYIANTVYVGNGTEGNVIQIDAIKNRQILMVFQGDKLLEPTMYNYVANTGTIALTYDVENGQVIQILTRNII